MRRTSCPPDAAECAKTDCYIEWAQGGGPLRQESCYPSPLNGKERSWHGVNPIRPTQLRFLGTLFFWLLRRALSSRTAAAGRDDFLLRFNPLREGKGIDLGLRGGAKECPISVVQLGLGLPTDLYAIDGRRGARIVRFGPVFLRHIWEVSGFIACTV